MDEEGAEVVLGWFYRVSTVILFYPSLPLFPPPWLILRHAYSSTGLYSSPTSFVSIPLFYAASSFFYHIFVASFFVLIILTILIIHSVETQLRNEAHEYCWRMMRHCIIVKDKIRLANWHPKLCLLEYVCHVVFGWRSKGSFQLNILFSACYFCSSSCFQIGLYLSRAGLIRFVV